MNTTTTTERPATQTLDLPCPEWCECPTGHGWESVDADGVAWRTHEKYIDPTFPAYVAVIAKESAQRARCCDDSPICGHPIVAAGPSTTAAAGVSVALDDFNLVEPDQALRLAELIRQASQAVDRTATSDAPVAVAIPVDRGPVTPLACPTWCTVSASDHQAEASNPFSSCLIHEGAASAPTRAVEGEELRVQLSQLQLLAGQAGESDEEGPTVLIFSGPDSGLFLMLPVVQAIELATNLLDAATTSSKEAAPHSLVTSQELRDVVAQLVKVAASVEHTVLSAAHHQARDEALQAAFREVRGPLDGQAR